MSSPGQYCPTVFARQTMLEAVLDIAEASLELVRSEKRRRPRCAESESHESLLKGAALYEGRRTGQPLASTGVHFDLFDSALPDAEGKARVKCFGEIGNRHAVRARATQGLSRARDETLFVRKEGSSR